MAKVAVTGGSGFIGSHVVDALISAGHEVTIVDHRVRPQRSDVRFEDVDLLDFSSVLAALKGNEHIFHLAAVSNVNYAFKYPVYSTALNVLGTTNVLEAARLNSAQRVYLASTVWVYNGAPDGVPADETVPFHLHGAGHIYTSTKMAAEMLCHNYGELYGVPFTILRYGIPYGPRMREDLLIPIFMKKALRGEALTVAGRGTQFRKFLYVRDIAQAHVLAMQDKAVGQTYNLEGKHNITVLEVAEAVRGLVGSHVEIQFVGERAGDFAGREVTSKKASDELGWAPQIEFGPGLAHTYDWFCERWGYDKTRTRPIRAVARG